jgi:hypothetical protein
MFSPFCFPDIVNEDSNTTMKPFLFFPFFFLCLSLHSMGQTSVQVDPNTGQASMNIPIWTVNSGDLAYPISLNYLGGGVKVNDTEQTAGMNWSISNPGVVYREVRGLPDDFVGPKAGVTNDTRNGWLHGSVARLINNFSPAADANLTTCSDEIADWNTLNSFAYNYDYDTEPDIFSFSAPGLSGVFLFDKNKNIVTAPYQDLKIQTFRSATDSLIYQIVITSNEGVKYTFQGGDKVTRSAKKKNVSTIIKYFSTLYNYYRLPVVYYSSWYLTSISSLKGGLLTFVYSGSRTIESADLKRTVNASNAIDTMYYDYYSKRVQNLQYVTGSNEKASFQWSGGLLSNISINDLTNQSAVKKFILRYKYISGSYKTYKRSFLSEIYEDVNCNKLPSYKFSYYGINFTTNTTSIPFNSSLGQDLFGYYDSTATSQVPEIYVLSGDAGADGERYRISPAPGYNLVAGGGRSVNATKVYYGSLKSVTMPTGGTTILTYEPADYYDPLTNTTIMGGGIRVKQIKSAVANDPASGVTSTYSYKRSKSSLQSSGQWTYRPMFAFTDGTDLVRVPDNLAPEESILYSRVEVSRSGEGRTVYEFQNRGLYNETTFGDFKATLSRIARRDPQGGACISLGNLRTGYYTFPYPVNTNYEFERSLPTRISYYTADRKKIVSQKIYSYQRTTLPVTQVSGIKFEKFNTTFQYGKYTLLGNVDKVKLTEATRSFDQTDTTKYIETSSTYTYNGYKMLSQKTTTNSDNSIFTNTFKYAKDYNTTGTDTQSQMIDSLVANNQHGTLIESISSSGASILGANLTLFNKFGPRRILPSSKLVLSDPTGFTASTVSGSSFKYSANYTPVSFIDAYDALGNPTITRDQSRIVKSVIMGFNNSYPVLEISNARYDQVVYSDFEANGNSRLTYPGSFPTATASWSGMKSLILVSTTVASQNVARGKGNFYKFSCWAKASAATTLTIKFNSGVWVSNTLAYPSTGALNTWQYIEKRIDISSVPADTNFDFQLSSSGSVYLDNVAFYPESADIVMHSYDPLVGKTADFDSRGNGVYQEYDAAGRLRYVRNTDKDIVLIKDYHYASSNGMTPTSTFSYNPSIKTGDAVTFTGEASCVPGVTYSWFVDDVNQNSNSLSLTRSFNENKDYRVRFVVSSTNYGSSSTEALIHPTSYTGATLTFTQGSATFIGCDDGHRQVTATANLIGCYEPNISYDWWMRTAGGPDVHLATTSTNSYSQVLQANTSYVIKCYVNNVTCFNYTTNLHDAVPGLSCNATFLWNYDDCTPSGGVRN